LVPRRNEQRDLRRRENSPIGKGKKEGQDDFRRSLSGHPDRLRLFPHILWKSWTRFRVKSRRFGEYGEKIGRKNVENSHGKVLCGTSRFCLSLDD